MDIALWHKHEKHEKHKAYLLRCFLVTTLAGAHPILEFYKPKFSFLTWCRNTNQFLDLGWYGIRAMSLFKVYGKLRVDRNSVRLFFTSIIVWSIKLMVKVCLICNITCPTFVHCSVARASKAQDLPIRMLLVHYFSIGVYSGDVLKILLCSIIGWHEIWAMFSI